MSIVKDYKNDGISSYVTITLAEGQKLSTYQLRLLESMKCEFILPAELRSEAGTSVMYFNISSRNNLIKVLEHMGSLNKSQFIDFFRELFNVLLSEKRQQLKANYFIVEPELLFFDKRNGLFKPEFIYLPSDDLQLDLIAQFKSLLKYLIPLKVNYAEDEGYYRGILKATDNPNTNMTEFKDMILNSSFTYYPPKAEQAPAQQPQQPKPATQNDAAQLKQPVHPPKNQNKVVTPAKPIPAPPQPAKAASVAQPAGQAIVKNKNRLIILGLIQLLFVLLAVTMIVGLSMTDAKSIFGITLILGALDFLAVYFIGKKLPKNVPAPARAPKIKDQIAVKAQQAAPQAPKIEKREEPYENPGKTEFLFPPVSSDDNAASRTAFLGKEARLICVTPEYKAEYVLSANRKYIVGRSKSSDIFIDKSTVSSRHLSLECVNGDWFASDLKSSNFSFIDARKLAPEQKEKLADGANIKLADIEFRFMQG